MRARFHIVSAYKEAGVVFLAEELDRVVSELERLAAASG